MPPFAFNRDRGIRAPAQAQGEAKIAAASSRKPNHLRDEVLAPLCSDTSFSESPPSRLYGPTSPVLSGSRCFPLGNRRLSADCSFLEESNPSPGGRRSHLSEARRGRRHRANCRGSIPRRRPALVRRNTTKSWLARPPAWHWHGRVHPTTVPPPSPGPSFVGNSLQGHRPRHSHGPLSCASYCRWTHSELLKQVGIGPGLREGVR
jgi:hypothetical protein